MYHRMEIICRKCINIEVPNNICMPEKVRNRKKTALILLLVAIILSLGGLVWNVVSNTGYSFTDTAVKEYSEIQRATPVEATSKMFDGRRGNLTGYKEIAWYKSDDPKFDHYEIYMSTERDCKPNSTNFIMSIPDRETTEAEIEGLIPDETYYVKLLHIDNEGEVLRIESGIIRADDATGKEEMREDSLIPGFGIFGVFICVLIIVLVFGGPLPGLRPRN